MLKPNPPKIVLLVSVDGKKPTRSISSENFEKPYPPIIFGVIIPLKILTLINPSKEL